MKNKLFGFLERDTIFSGDWSIHGKFHTIENVIRVIATYLLFIGSININYWLIIPAIFGIGFTIRPEYMRPTYKFKLW